MAREEKRVGFQGLLGDCFVKLKDRFCSISQSISFIFMYMRRDVLGIDHDHDHDDDDALVVPQVVCHHVARWKWWMRSKGSRRLIALNS